jgi:hypothetical protein
MALVRPRRPQPVPVPLMDRFRPELLIVAAAVL